MLSLSPFHVLQSININSKEAIRLGVENLLNTRCRFLGWPERYKSLARSVINYGLPSFISQELVNEQDKTRFCKRIEQAIHLHEPRLSDVKVTLAGDISSEQQANFCFTIAGYIVIDKHMEPFLFDSYLKQETGDFYVS